MRSWKTGKVPFRTLLVYKSQGQEWSEGRVIAARVFVLVRSLQVSSRYVNNNTYQVGDIQVPGNGDGYRRLLLESSVSLRNPAVIAGGGK
ncbi:hypothetical protein GWG10_03195 [Aeromonas caviae]|nr:hypothetical protein GWG10_03195 [Aeromonas caviae]